MAGFDAKTAVSPLDWNFEPYAGTGTVPDPSFDDQQEFVNDLSRTFGFSPGSMDETSLANATQALVKKVGEGDDPAGQVNAIIDSIYDATAKLCKGSPSLTDLKALPPRVFFAFLGWLFGEINPLGEAEPTRTIPALAGRSNGGYTS